MKRTLRKQRTLFSVLWGIKRIWSLFLLHTDYNLVYQTYHMTKTNKKISMSTKFMLMVISSIPFLLSCDPAGELRTRNSYFSSSSRCLVQVLAFRGVWMRPEDGGMYSSLNLTATLAEGLCRVLQAPAVGPKLRKHCDRQAQAGPPAPAVLNLC